MLTSKNWNQYALVPAKKNGFPSIAKFWSMVWTKPLGLMLLIPLAANAVMAESKRDTSGGFKMCIPRRGKPNTSYRNTPTTTIIYHPRHLLRGTT